MDLIDSRIEDGMDRSDIEESLIGDMMDETPFHFCMSYALWKLESDRERNSTPFSNKGSRDEFRQ